MKFALVLIIDTFVVDSPRVNAAVNRLHMMALNARLRRKNTPRMRYSSGRLGVER